MSSSNDPCLTLLIPQYRTRDLTKLCLRTIRTRLDISRLRVIVIDNDSGDESMEYLKSVPWIHLIERKALPGEKPAQAHARALDLGLAETDTDFVMSIHTDTFFLDDKAPEMLLKPFGDPMVAGTGSWKLESFSPWKRAGKTVEQFLRNYVAAPFKGRKFGELTRCYRDHWYLRSHCAIYRTSLLKSMQLKFDEGETAGIAIHRKLVAAGYRMVFFQPEELMPHMIHLDHATMILNPEMGGRRTANPSARHQLQKALDRMHYRKLLDASMEDC